MPFEVQPSTMASVVKGLYSLRPGDLCFQKPRMERETDDLFHSLLLCTDFWFPLSEWAQLAPDLFSGFIPQINPPAVESLLPDYAAHDQKLQMELSMTGFPRSVS